MPTLLPGNSHSSLELSGTGTRQVTGFIHQEVSVFKARLASHYIKQGIPLPDHHPTANTTTL